jgi:hypothetical protein
VARIWQVTWHWTGTSGGNGYTNLYFGAQVGDGTEAFSACNKSRALFDGVKSLLPDPVNISLVSDVRLIEDTTGDLVNIFTVVGPSAVNGTGGSGSYAGASGGCVDWLTGLVHGKHLMVGRTFFVPMVNLAYSSTGSLASTTVVTIGTAAQDMSTSAGPVFGVWGRPRKAVTVGGISRPALVGQFAPAISNRVPNKAVVLRSRRD